jgi:hypothetical protein
MEHHPDNSFAGVFVTILLTAFSWFMNFVSHADALMQLLLHFVQIIAALCAILVALSTIVPPFKAKIVKFFKSFL